MKAFIERIFKARKEKKLKEVLQEADKFVQDKATQAAIEAIQIAKPDHTNDCECNKCINWRKQNAK